MRIISPEAERDMLREYLLLCAKQLDDEEVEEVTVESLIAEGEVRRAAEGLHL